MHWCRIAGLVHHRIERRCFHSTGKRKVQRLLWAGTVLDRTSPSLKQVPKDWLLSLGVQADVEQGISFLHLAASPSHSLISYVTLPPSLPQAASDEDRESNDDKPKVYPSGLQKIVSIGRNTFGELGLGFSSQESTWGMVTGDFEGSGGIKAIQTGLGSSCLVTSTGLGADSPTLLYTFGNHTSGQLGLGGCSTATGLSKSGETQLQLYSTPRQVSDERLADAQLEYVARGLDHAIMLFRMVDGSQAVFTCGINTDGQLGESRIRISSPNLVRLQIEKFDPLLPPTSHDPIVGVAAGGDSSMIWTESGRIWGWGNSEYGQCLVKGVPIERIERPTEASQIVAESVAAKIVDVKFGGSFVVVLDEAGNVYTAGFGALGQGRDYLESHRLRKVLSHATSISTGLEQASAVVRHPETKQENIMVWGLNTAAGRLGIGGRKPYPSYMIASRFTAEEIEHRVWEPCPVDGWQEDWAGKGEKEAGVKAVAHGRDVIWILVEDGNDEVGRWAGR